MNDDPRTVAATYFRAWKDKDFATLRSILADEVTFRGPLASLDDADACVDGLQGMSQIMTVIAIHHTFVDGPDVLTWFDLHHGRAAGADRELESRRGRQDHRDPGDLRRPPAGPARAAMTSISVARPNQPTPERSHPMSIMAKSRAGRIFGRVKEIWAELDYAQRRSLEITTGIPSLPRPKRPPTGASVSELESLYALADHDGLSDRHASPDRGSSVGRQAIAPSGQP